MKTTTILALGAIAALGIYLAQKQRNYGDSEQVITSPVSDTRAVSPSQLAALGTNPSTGINYPATFAYVEQQRAQGASNAEIVNRAAAQMQSMKSAPSTITKPGTSSSGYYFPTAGGKTGYASSAVTSIKTVPKEQSIAYKLGYIK